jgi:hypothetical protein
MMIFKNSRWGAFMSILYGPVLAHDFRCLSMAVVSWYRHFGVKASEQSSQVLCSAAIGLFNNGRTEIEDLAEGLIEMFPVPDLLKVNAPTSSSTH